MSIVVGDRGPGDRVVGLQGTTLALKKRVLYSLSCRAVTQNSEYGCPNFFLKVVSK